MGLSRAQLVSALSIEFPTQHDQLSFLAFKSDVGSVGLLKTTRSPNKRNYNHCRHDD